MSNSDSLNDTELVSLLKKMLTNKGKKAIEKQKAIYKATKKKLMTKLVKEDENKNERRE